MPAVETIPSALTVSFGLRVPALVPPPMPPVAVYLVCARFMIFFT